MAQIIQLEIPLFNHVEETPVHRVKDPCFDCWAKGLCDDGECGMKIFSIDE